MNILNTFLVVSFATYTVLFLYLFIKVLPPIRAIQARHTDEIDAIFDSVCAHTDEMGDLSLDVAKMSGEINEICAKINDQHRHAEELSEEDHQRIQEQREVMKKLNEMINSSPYAANKRGRKQ